MSDEHPPRADDSGPIAAGSVIVGVHEGQPDTVVDTAAEFAHRFHCDLVCAYVNTGRYGVAELIDGSITSMPLDVDLADISDPGIPIELTAQLERLLDPLGVRWIMRELAGDPARALGHLAQTLGASMIVVGARRSTVRGTVSEFFGGSVAVHLAHRQHIPIVVVPTNPTPFDHSLPWESGS